MVRYITLVILFALLSFMLFANPFHFPKELWEMITPWATLTLAFTTVFVVLQSDIRERRNKTISRLADIIEWAEDVIRLTHTVETKNITLDAQQDTTYVILQIRDKIEEFRRQRESGNHIQIIASRINKPLYVRVKSILRALDEILEEDWVNPSLSEIWDKLNIHETRIYGLANPLKDDVLKKLEEV